MNVIPRLDLEQRKTLKVVCWRRRNASTGAAYTVGAGAMYSTTGAPGAGAMNTTGAAYTVAASVMYSTTGPGATWDTVQRWCDVLHDPAALSCMLVAASPRNGIPRSFPASNRLEGPYVLGEDDACVQFLNPRLRHEGPGINEDGGTPQSMPHRHVATHGCGSSLSGVLTSVRTKAPSMDSFRT